MRRLFAVMAAFGLLLVGCSSDDEFVFGEHDVCSWISDDAVAEAVSDAFGSMGMEWQGVAEVDDARSNAEGCVWILTSESTDGSVWVGGSQNWAYPDTEDVVDYSGDDPTTDGFVSGYPALNENVAVRADAFETYQFWVEGTQKALSLGVRFTDPALNGEIQPTVLVANRILEELNWTG